MSAHGRRKRERILARAYVIALVALIAAIASGCGQSGPTPTPMPDATVASCKDIAGVYEGNLANATTATTSAIHVEIVQSGCTITGNLTVFPPLTGSGPLSGEVTSSAVSFTVTTTQGASTAQLAFEGAAGESDGLSGAFEVPPWALGNADTQTGQWTLVRVP